MKKLAVAVLSEDMGYAKALSRGLAEERKNIYIKPICVDNFSAAQREKLIDELTELGYILVADFDINERDELIILTECDVCDLCCNKISKFSPVRAIFQKITEIYFEKNKIEFSYLMEDDTKILGVLSPWHSSGPFRPGGPCCRRLPKPAGCFGTAGRGQCCFGQGSRKRQGI